MNAAIGHPNWNKFYLLIKSGQRYKKAIFDFRDWCVAHGYNLPTTNFVVALHEYLTELHTTNKLAGNSIVSVYSIFKKFWLHGGLGDLEQQDTLLKASVYSWAKGHVVTKARVMEHEEWQKFLMLNKHLATTEEFLTWWQIAPYFIANLSQAARGEEAAYQYVDALQQVFDPVLKRPTFTVDFTRCGKDINERSSDGTSALITGTFEVRVLTLYKSFFRTIDAPGTNNVFVCYYYPCPYSPLMILNVYCIPAVLLESRLWRKLRFDKMTGEIAVTNAPIGVNTLAGYGKSIGLMIGLSDEEAARMTGHTKRRTAITFMAEMGMTLPQIKAATGHNSDSVVQNYINNSKRMKRIAAAAVSCITSQEEEAGAAAIPKRVCVRTTMPSAADDAVAEVARMHCGCDCHQCRTTVAAAAVIPSAAAVIASTTAAASSAYAGAVFNNCTVQFR